MHDFSDLAAWSSEDRDALHEAVDASDYALSDWTEALAGFDRWLSAKGEERRPRREMVGYIHCCTYSASPGIGLGRLEVIVYQALTEFGFAFIEDTQV